MLKRKAAGLAAALLAAAASARAQEADPGSSALTMLRLPVGARAVGMAGAFSAMEDPDSLYYNPAGLGSLRRVALSGMYTKGLEDTNLQHLSFAAPLPWGFMTDEYPVVAAVGAMFDSLGSIDVNTLNPDGSLGNSSTLNAGHDMVLSLTLAQHFADDLWHDGDKTYVNEHHFGVTAKYITSTLGQAYTAQTVAFDAGYLYKLQEPGLAFGVSVLNLGPDIQYDKSGDPLPTSLRGGGAWQVPFKLEDSHLTVAADAEHFTHENQTQEYLGAEYVYQRYFAMRGGWRIGTATDGPTFGFGFNISGIQLDYAFEFNSDLSSSHRFSLRYSFDTPWKLQLTRTRNWQQILEAPSLEEIQRQGMPQKQDNGMPADNPNKLPIIPGWIQ